MTQDIAAHDHAQPDYLKIWIALMVLMAISVGLSFLPLAQTTTTVLIMMLSTVKAVLVILYFMHVRYERILIGMLVATPLILFGVLIGGLLPDFVLGAWPADPYFPAP